MDYIAVKNLSVAPIVAAAGGVYAWFWVDGGAPTWKGRSSTLLFKLIGSRVVVASSAAWVLNKGLDMSGLATGTMSRLQPWGAGLGVAYVYYVKSNKAKDMLLNAEVQLYKLLDKILPG